MNNISVVSDFNPSMFSETAAPIVSIYLRTHRFSPENRQDRMRYKNHVAEAEALLAQTYEKREYSDILALLSQISEDHERDIWRQTKDGLAVLASKDSAFVYHLDYPVEDIVTVSDSYHIKPLIRNFQYGTHYYLLAVSAKNFELYLGDFNSLEKLAMPEGVESEFSKVYDDFDNTSSINVGAFAGMDGRFYGRDSKNEIVEKETEKYFRYIDKTVKEHFLAEHPYPVILVSLTQHQSPFREISTLPTLLPQGIEKPAESMSEAELHAKAKEIIEEVQDSSICKLIDSFGLAQSQDRASTDPATIANALTERKVSTLFIETGRIVPGHYEAETGTVVFGQTEQQGNNDLANDFALATYLQGGEVYAFEAASMPADTGVAALFRY